MTIEVLPDDVILAIFTFFVDTICIESWYTLVQVCRRWRHVVFAYPRHLNLRVLCTDRTAARSIQDVWPVLPIVVRGTGDPRFLKKGADNIIAALELRDRVCAIDLPCIPDGLLEGFVAATQVQFPALTSLSLGVGCTAHSGTILPDSFLGGSAPRLRTLLMDAFALPTLPQLLLSATDLVQLFLWDTVFPNYCGYIAPETMTICLSAMTKLDVLDLRFRSRRFRRSDQGSSDPPPLTFVVLPTLVSFNFRGSDEYLDELVARNNAPPLDDVNLTLFGELRLSSAQFLRFVNQAQRIHALSQANVAFCGHRIEVTFLTQARTAVHTNVSLEFPCGESDQLRYLARVCSSPLCLLFTLERLNIFEYAHSPREWEEDDMEWTHWLNILRRFITVKDMYLSEQVVPRVSFALRELTEHQVTEVLPMLQHLFLEGLESSEAVQNTFGEFISTRRLSGHPLVIHSWQREHM